MIQLSARGKAIYELLHLTVALLLLYAGAVLLAALSAAPALQGLSAALLQQSLLTFLLALGLAQSDARQRWLQNRLWRRLWFLQVLLSLLLQVLDAPPLLVNGGTALLLLCVLAQRSGGSLRLWRGSLLLLCIGLLLQPFSPSSLSAALVVFQRQVAFGWGSLCIVLWLLPRLQPSARQRLPSSARVMVLCIALGGSSLSLAQLEPPPLLAWIAASTACLCYLLLASHSLRALRGQHANASLAGHWLALALLFWLVGSGILGSLSLLPGAPGLLRGGIPAAQAWLGDSTQLLLALAGINEMAMALRGDNRRVTGYVPLWLCGFGAAFAGILQVCITFVQRTLTQLGALGAPASAGWLQPLQQLWMVCLLAWAAGIAFYALGYALRRRKVVLGEP